MTSTEKLKLFSARFRERVKVLRLKKKDIAAAIGVGPSAITGYGAGDYFPSRDTSTKLAKLLECSEQWLIGDSDKLNSDEDRNASSKRVPIVSEADAGTIGRG